MNAVRRAPHAAGVTLVELLLVVTLFAGALAAVVGVLSAVIRVWETARAEDQGLRDVFLGLELLERDLRNAVPFHAVPPSGDARSLTVAARVIDPTGGARRLGTIAYGFDPGNGVLQRRAWTYPDAPPVAGEPVMQGLDRFRLSYRMAHPTQPGVWEWVAALDPERGRPTAVRVEFAIDEEDRSSDVVVRTIRLPVH